MFSTVTRSEALIALDDRHHTKGSNAIVVEAMLSIHAFVAKGSVTT